MEEYQMRPLPLTHRPDKKGVSEATRPDAGKWIITPSPVGSRRSTCRVLAPLALTDLRRTLSGVLLLGFADRLGRRPNKKRTKVNFLVYGAWEIAEANQRLGWFRPAQNRGGYKGSDFGDWKIRG